MFKTQTPPPPEVRFSPHWGKRKESKVKMIRMIIGFLLMANVVSIAMLYGAYCLIPAVIGLPLFLWGFSTVKKVWREKNEV